MGDVRLALRMLVKRPVFTLVAVITLAVGIGANTAIFSVVNSGLPPPRYGEPDRIVGLSEQGVRSIARVSFPNFLDWRQRSTSFDAMAAYAWTPTRSSAAASRASPRCAASATASSRLRRFNRDGRTFAAEELQGHGVPAAIVSHRFWERTLFVGRRSLRLCAARGRSPGTRDRRDARDVRVSRRRRRLGPRGARSSPGRAHRAQLVCGRATQGRRSARIRRGRDEHHCSAAQAEVRQRRERHRFV